MNPDDRPLSRVSPPKAAISLLHWYCADKYLEEVQGDLQELFLERLDQRGRRTAAILFWVDVIFFFRPYLMRKQLFSIQSGGLAMFQNYIKVALRNLLRYKGYSFINIAGLVIGLATAILILLYIQDELSFDKFHPDYERIYRVTSEEIKDDKFSHFAYAFGPVAPRLLNDFPDIDQAVRVFPYSVSVQQDLQKQFQENQFVFADSTFFEVFGFRLKSGNPRTALQSPYAIVITEKIARKYFGNQDPIGQTLTVENSYHFQVTAVLENIPSNSHLQFDFLASMGSVRDILSWALTGWHYPPMYTYLKLPPHYDSAALQAQFPDFLARNMGSWAPERRRMFLQPMADIRLHSQLEGEMVVTGSAKFVYIFATVAFFILLIACINFMNLATARSVQRAREVGLRKVFGARRHQLVNQFFGESIFYAFFSLLLALLLVEALLPYVNQLLDKQLAVDYLNNWPLIAALIILTGLVGLLSGSYPALLLSRFRPAAVLKGGKLSGAGNTAGIRFRSLLVVVQFAISIALIINANIIRDQLYFLKNKSLGFSKEQIVVVPVRDEVIQKNWTAIKNKLLTNPDIVAVTATSTIPGIDRDIDFPVKLEGMSDYADWNMPVMLVDHDFNKTFDIDILQGRDFSEEFATDQSSAIILNESARKRLGWDAPLGKKLEIHSVASGNDKAGQVIGIVKDFHFRSLHNKIDPLLLTISPRHYYYDNIAIKIDSRNMAGVLAFLGQTWQEIVPNRPLEYEFLDAIFAQLYQREEKLGKIFDYFAGLAIFIGCLGLFGLTAFTTERRTREIGIRKALGASVSNIVVMLSRELILLILIAFVIAAPVAYFAMSAWLQDFSYKIDIGLLTFIISGGVALVIALLTVSYQAIKAALTSPSEALRYE